MLDLLGLAVRAISVGGLETCIELPAWKLCFDIGRCPPTAVRVPMVLFTHGHTDHMGGAAYHCSLRDLMGMEPPTYVVPAENEAAFHDLMDAWRRLDRSEFPCHVVAVKPGDRMDLPGHRWMQVFRAVHRVPSLGYALGRTVHKLRADLEGVSGREIARLRARGEEVSEAVDIVEVAFCGDTTIDVWDREPLVRSARRLILEVTFLDDRVPVERARRSGHVHLDEVVERADRFENEAVLFTHVSARYRPAEFERIVHERLPASLSQRVQCLRADSTWVNDPA